MSAPVFLRTIEVHPCTSPYRVSQNRGLLLLNSGTSILNLVGSLWKVKTTET